MGVDEQSAIHLVDLGADATDAEVAPNHHIQVASAGQ
jgi:hypothetical protein